jgi:predicted amidohydrolase
VKIAAFQMEGHRGDIEANLTTIGDAAREAAAQGAALLVAPELALTGYGAGEAISRLAAPADGREAAVIRSLAAENRLHLVVGFAERVGEAIYNAALLATRDGQLFVYRKCHLYGDYERDLFVPGCELPQPIELDGISTGVLICYDVEFPEAVRRLAVSGAELVLVPTALPAGKDSTFIAEKLVPVRAFENQVAIVYANHAGDDGKFCYAGLSCIAMPDGSDATRAPANGSTLLVAEYEKERFSASRRANPYLADRRADLYSRR